MPDSAYFESKQLYNTIRQYTEQIKSFNNQLHSLRLLPVPGKDTIKSIEKIIAGMEKEIKLLEQKTANIAAAMAARSIEKCKQHQRHW